VDKAVRTLEFSKLSKQMYCRKKNRASEMGGALHIGGSITTHEHVLHMVHTLIVCICHIWTTFLKFEIKSNLTL